MNNFLDEYPIKWSNPEYTQLRDLLIAASGSAVDKIHNLEHLASLAGIKNGTFPTVSGNACIMCQKIIEEMGFQRKLRKLVEVAASWETIAPDYQQQFAVMLELPRVDSEDNKETYSAPQRRAIGGDYVGRDKIEGDQVKGNVFHGNVTNLYMNGFLPASQRDQMPIIPPISKKDINVGMAFSDIYRGIEHSVLDSEKKRVVEAVVLKIEQELKKREAGSQEKIENELKKLIELSAETFNEVTRLLEKI